ncbi:MAG: DUF2914 domain-containing protein, partial [Methylomonas sp.]|nr:DUF2914 domain-containing protein [Methylomonas sp.]
AIAILTLLITLIFFWVSAGENDSDNLDSQKNAEQYVNTQARETTDIESPAYVMPTGSLNSTDAQRPSAIIFDKRVIRASLNTEPHYGEPGEPVPSPVIIKQDHSVELYYFSEIKNMKGRVLFHRWLKNGQTAYKKQFSVEADKFKLISSRKFEHKDAGEWQVVLIDNKGKRYSEVNFSINP